MLPSGTWWSTREPVACQGILLGMVGQRVVPFSWWKRVKKMDFIARVGI
jgi:hypothetical protein